MPWNLRHWSLLPISTEFPESQTPDAACELRAKQQQCESVQIDPLLISMCITFLVLDFSMSGVCPV